MQLLFSNINKQYVRSKPNLMELMRFVIVGVIATALHYGVYFGLLHYTETNIAYTIGYLVSFVVNFYLSIFFTFKTKATVKKGVGFGLSHAINYMLHIALLNLFIWLGLSKQFAPFPVFAIVIPINFLLVRTFLKSK